jgi:hypothetical protein
VQNCVAFLTLVLRLVVDGVIALGAFVLVTFAGRIVATVANWLVAALAFVCGLVVGGFVTVDAVRWVLRHGCGVRGSWVYGVQQRSRKNDDVYIDFGVVCCDENPDGKRVI